MKILYHHRTLSRDGQSVHIDELIRALRECGHEVVIAGPAQHAASDFGADGGAVARLKQMIPGALYEAMEVLYNLPAFWRLWKAWRALRPDVIYERYNLFLLAGAWLSRLTRTPFLLEINAPIMEERSKFGGLSLKGVGRWAQGSAWRAADAALPVTGVLGKSVAAYGVDPARLHVIPNGVAPEFLHAPPDTAAAKRALGIDADLVLGFVGFMRPWHGLDRVVDFIADSGLKAGMHFLVIGDGPAKDAIEQRARERGVSNQVTFTGLVPREKIIAHIAAFDIALQPDVVAYASPLKLFEYMALGKAVIAPATENIREVLDGSNAILFDPADPTAFRAAMERLAHDTALRQRLGAAARETVLTRDLTWLGNAKRVGEIAAKLTRR